MIFKKLYFFIAICLFMINNQAIVSAETIKTEETNKDLISALELSFTLVEKPESAADIIEPVDKKEPDKKEESAKKTESIQTDLQRAIALHESLLQTSKLSKTEVLEFLALVDKIKFKNEEIQNHIRAMREWLNPSWFGLKRYEDLVSSGIKKVTGLNLSSDEFILPKKLVPTKSFVSDDYAVKVPAVS